MRSRAYPAVLLITSINEPMAVFIQLDASPTLKLALLDRMCIESSLSYALVGTYGDALRAASLLLGEHQQSRVALGISNGVSSHRGGDGAEAECDPPFKGERQEPP